MRENGRSARRTHRRVLTTNSRHEDPVAANLFHRDFPATEPNKKWLTDVTSIATTRGWLSLAVVLDVYSLLVVGWSLSENNDEELVEKALRMALLRRRPKPGLLHHSDRGSRYTGRAYRRLAEQSGMLMSMSRKAKCWENAAMESVRRCAFFPLVGNVQHHKSERD